MTECEKCVIKEQIIYELYRTVELLGGESDILSILGSFNDTMVDVDVLDEIKYWNECNNK